MEYVRVSAKANLLPIGIARDRRALQVCGDTNFGNDRCVVPAVSMDHSVVYTPIILPPSDLKHYLDATDILDHNPLTYVEADVSVGGIQFNWMYVARKDHIVIRRPECMSVTYFSECIGVVEAHSAAWGDWSPPQKRARILVVPNGWYELYTNCGPAKVQ